MRSPYYPSRKRKHVLKAKPLADASQVRNAGSRCPLTLTVGNVDLPAFVSNGKLYIQAPLPNIFKAFAENLSEFISDLEIRISDSRGRALSLDSDGRPIPSERMA